LDRVSQVSALAALDLRVVLVGVVLVLGCALAVRFGRAAPAVRVAAAAIAGLATGLAGAGIALALRGTVWPLFATGGDSGALVTWADVLLAGRDVPVAYPPGVINLIAWTAELTGGSTVDALKLIHIVGTAVFGPVAYLAWRLVLPPLWALAVTLVAAVPLLEPYKPYTTVVLVVLVPVLVRLLSELSAAGRASTARVAVTGLAAGATLGLLALLYTGWFLWSLPGAVVALLVAFPWRAAPLRGLALCVLAAGALAAVAGRHLVAIVVAAADTRDYFFYFDTFVDPTYFAMWRNDFGADGPWPPPGELAGVGVFTLLLVVGLGAAIAFGGRRTSVRTVVALLAGAWVLRLWLASRMYETQTVQLYPRTSAQILFCLLVLAVLAARYGGRRAQARRPVAASDGARRLLPVGVLAAALLLALSMGSSIADRHMPRAENGPGMLAYVSQMVRQPDGTCADYSRGGCLDSGGAVLARIPAHDMPPDQIIG
jgi:galactan 5-O-arabinofuranosyltransferase